ncbi:L-aspartate oxidase [Frateuria soli]|uniref:L-aspartate oxidase n=1 Tax=Frateuria soli TaxID=1542730 RepID=UPI001E561C4D|nr:FAD-binding protein [Frateuria soli]UGB39571.1 FAD-binding protein [Frateuria soli]
MRADAPVLIVGTGVAGLATALAAAPRPVRLLCRAHDGVGSASALAQGGIAAAMGAADSAGAHAHDTLVAGAHHNDAAAVRWLTSAAPQTVAWLAAQGVAFDRDEDGALRLGREGGHGVPRIVHAGGDATGAALVQALRAQAQRAAHIQWRGGVDVEALLWRDDRVAGVRTRDERGREEIHDAAHVVLATGGIGNLFARTSNPPGADGAGLALGLVAGAAARDLEFVQFHPTALDLPRRQGLPLVTEALRGAGASLRDARGRPLMEGVHPLGDLAPRDVVARRVWEACQQGGAWLDATAVADWPHHFPTVLAACREHGIDPRTVPIPVTPAVHFHMGGLAVDLDGDTGVPGLHAVGEVACNGVHGGNRLASNSLLEGVACGRRLGTRLATLPWAARGQGATRWIERGPGLDHHALTALRQLMWTAAGPQRDAATLREALRQCGAWHGWQARLAETLLLAALRRAGSLGSHWRRDARAAQRPEELRPQAACDQSAHPMPP